jgi:hypothetical protein
VVFGEINLGCALGFSSHFVPSGWFIELTEFTGLNKLIELNKFTGLNRYHPLTQPGQAGTKKINYHESSKVRKHEKKIK